LLSLYLDRRDFGFVERVGMDGAYTYFASDGFTEGSTPSMWQTAALEFRDAGKLFVPSVGPGYKDTGIRPWNYMNTKDREGGAYYERMWRAAMEAEPFAITITSYNEWGEGTQIEPARPHSAARGPTSDDYSPGDPEHYMQLTRTWVDKVMVPCGATGHGNEL